MTFIMVNTLNLIYLKMVSKKRTDSLIINLIT
jgi:hypothetical protein